MLHTNSGSVINTRRSPLVCSREVQPEGIRRYKVGPKLLCRVIFIVPPFFSFFFFPRKKVCVWRTGARRLGKRSRLAACQTTSPRTFKDERVLTEWHGYQ